jgi:circadian clock protein KaiB
MTERPIVTEKDNNFIEEDIYRLRLFVTGATPNSSRAIANIKEICEGHLRGKYELEIIDVYQQPFIAEREQLIALPMLIKHSPSPKRRLIGDMSDTEKVLRGLNVSAM